MDALGVRPLLARVFGHEPAVTVMRLVFAAKQASRAPRTRAECPVANPYRGSKARPRRLGRKKAQRGLWTAETSVGNWTAGGGATKLPVANDRIWPDPAVELPCHTPDFATGFGRPTYRHGRVIVQKSTDRQEYGPPMTWKAHATGRPPARCGKEILPLRGRTILTGTHWQSASGSRW